MATSPTAEGFRAAFRRPSFTFAEIAWRWAVGATATGIALFGLTEYLSTLPVTNGELLFLHTGQPYLVAEAIARIFLGSMNRVVITVLLAAFLLTCLWIVAASLGRLATVRALLNYFRRDVTRYVSAGNDPEAGVSASANRDVASNVSTNDLRGLMRLNFLRASVALASALALGGAAIVSGFVSSQTHPRHAFAFLIFLTLSGIVGGVAWTLNWLLSLAGVFCVRDNEDELGAISAAVAFWREHASAVSSVTTWTGLAHLGVFMIASVGIGMPLAFVAVAPWRPLVALMIALTLFYLALADWLYMARLAGYIAILELPEAPVEQAAPTPAGDAPIQTTIDRDEPILSDVSLLSSPA